MNEIKILITDLNQNGQGVGRHEGHVLFVEGTIPGDFVSVEIAEQHKQYAVATLISVLEPSPDRIEPSCVLADRCGGCALQSMDYTAQLQLKRRHVVELLTRLGKTPEAENIVSPTSGMENPYGYRCKVQFPIRGSASQPEIGFYERRSHQVVDGDTCEVGHPISDCVRQVVRRYIQKFAIEPYQEAEHSGTLRHLVIRIGRESGQVMVIMVSRTNRLPGHNWLISELKKAIESFRMPIELESRTRSTAQTFQLTTVVLNHQPQKTNVILGRENEPIFGQGWIEDNLLGLTFRISPLSFFQVNPEQTAILYQQAVTLAAIQPGEQVLDLYCGTGTIALALAQSAPGAQVIGVDSVAPAIADAQINAQANQLEPVTFKVAYAEKWLPQAIADGEIAPRVAVIDPPRKGCEEALLEALKTARLDRLVYISCNPATLARDLDRLSDTYRVQSVHPVDLFPWTDSIECVCLLKSV